MRNNFVPTDYLAIGAMADGGLGAWMVPSKKEAVVYAENSCGQKVKIYAVINNLHKCSEETVHINAIKQLSVFMHSISVAQGAEDLFNDAILNLTLEAFRAGMVASGKLALDQGTDYAALCAFLFNNSGLEILESFLDRKSTR